MDPREHLEQLVKEEVGVLQEQVVKEDFLDQWVLLVREALLDFQGK